MDNPVSLDRKLRETVRARGQLSDLADFCPRLRTVEYCIEADSDSLHGFADLKISSISGRHDIETDQNFTCSGGKTGCSGSLL
ncbi:MULTISPECIES: hypothetical protein [Sphingobium]|uniref:hypothetical protein n=1 Tax=Sphingobium TaxID=165695 RepID=UPI000A4A3AE5|nr:MULTISPECIES: hypothetical protein [Sphingobium]MCB4859003.1 hypothetical protein [Sphingobium sp. PNB]MEC6701526.1 hypothetical protein [Sphingobium sp. SJ10-10]NML91594.1 hypothetical protein [Sphingobium sp. TB-6]